MLIGKQSFFYPEIDSTNAESKRLIKQQKAKEGTVVLAGSQLQGKGKLGRPWFSPADTGIYLSLILYVSKTRCLPMGLSLLGTLAAARAIKRLTGLEVKVKWPNDIIINGKKVGGVLVEAVPFSSRKKAVIVGIGLNVNTEVFPPFLQGEASSIKLQSGRETDQDRLLSLLLEEFEKRHLKIKAGAFAEIREEWEGLSDTLGRKVRVVTARREFEGEAIGVGEAGELILKTGDGKIIKIHSGDLFYL